MDQWQAKGSGAITISVWKTPSNLPFYSPS